MSNTVVSFETAHDDMIHDAQMDYYGRKLATCSSDRTIKIFEVTGDRQRLIADLKGHDGPVFQVAWAHPKYGSLLASCSYDHKIFIWKEVAANDWRRIYEYSKHDSSVNSIAWAPHEFGLMLAGASSDGTVSIISYKEGEDPWEDVRLPAHKIGCNAVSWGPATSAGAILSAADAPVPTKRLVSGGCDGYVRVWNFNEQERKWTEEPALEGHSDWVRDVSWAPNIGLPFDTIASCSQDRRVLIWTQEPGSQTWTKKVLHSFPAIVWRVSWSITGNILAVSSGDNKVTLWKESLDGEWKCISTMADPNAAASSTATSPNQSLQM